MRKQPETGFLRVLYVCAEYGKEETKTRQKGVKTRINGKAENRHEKTAQEGRPEDLSIKVNHRYAAILGPVPGFSLIIVFIISYAHLPIGGLFD